MSTENGPSLKKMKTGSHPADELKSEAEKLGCKITDLKFARHMDSVDPVRHLRDMFFYPKNERFT